MATQIADSKTIPNAVLMSDDSISADIIENGLMGFVRIENIGRWNEANLIGFLESVDVDFLLLHRHHSDQKLLDMLNTISKRCPLPIILFVDQDDGNMTRDIVRAGVSSYVVDGLSASRVAPLVFVAVERYQVGDALKKELQKTKTDLADRKVIERAKGYLMKDRSLTEEEAYTTLRKMAMAQARPLREIAATIISFSQIVPHSKK